MQIKKLNIHFTYYNTLVTIFFLIALGVNLIRPYIPAYLKTETNIDLQYIGLVLSLTGIIQYGGSVFVALLFNIASPRLIYTSGIVIRIVGIALLIISIIFSLNATPLLGVIFIAVGASVFSHVHRILISSYEKSYQAISKHVAVNGIALNAGLSIAPFVASILILYTGYNGIYFSALAINLLVLFLFIYFIWPSPHVKEKTTTQNVQIFKSLKGSPYIRLFLSQMILSTAIVGYYYYFSIYATDINQAHVIGIFFGVYYIGIILCQYLLRNKIELLKYSKIIPIAALLQIVACILIYNYNTYYAIIAAILLAFGFGIVQIKQEVDVLVDTKFSRENYAIFRLCTGLGIIIGSNLHIKIYSLFTDKANYWIYLLAILMIANIVQYIMMSKKQYQYKG